MARGTWTDDRLDDLSRRMDTGFDRVDRDLREMRDEMRMVRMDLSGELQGLRGEMNQRMVRSDARFDALQGLILRVGGGMIIAMFGMIAALLARGG